SEAAGDPGLPGDPRSAGIRRRGRRADQPQGRTRLSDPRRHSDHAGERGEGTEGRAVTAAEGFAKSTPDGGSYESDDAPWPAELRVFQKEGRIEIDFTDGKSVDLPAEYLRVESPSAEVQGHGG